MIQQDLEVLIASLKNRSKENKDEAQQLGIYPFSCGLASGYASAYDIVVQNLQMILECNKTQSHANTHP